jgi:hypothetical protein
MWMAITSENRPDVISDHAITLKCPHCAVVSHMSAVSIPRFEYLKRFEPQTVGIGYRCGSCNNTVFLRFVPKYEFPCVHLSDEYEEVERPKETFEFQYLPEQVRRDFKEALDCYSISAFNAFAAMCRRCVQSAAADLGAKGKDKVLAQLQDLKDMAEIDNETFDLLKQIIIEGHDGAHPHLPAVDAKRAAVLLELGKDVMYQLYVRRGKLHEAMALRTEAIQAKTA